MKKRSRKITATFLDKQKSEFLQFGMTSLTSLIFKSCQFLNFSSNILMTGKALSPPSRKKSLGKNYNVTTQSFLLIYIFKIKWQLPSLSQGFPKFHTQIRDLMVGLQANWSYYCLHGIARVVTKKKNSRIKYLFRDHTDLKVSCISS